MAQKKLRTQDLMEVFNNKLDLANQKFDLNKEIIETLDSKLKELNMTSVKVDIGPLDSAIHEYTASFLKQRIQLLKISKEHYDIIKKSSERDLKHQLYFYGTLVIMFCICCAFVAFGSNQFHKRKIAEKKTEYFSREAYRRDTFLKEENLTKKYKSWTKTLQRKN